jgi:GNAT superfamily N-acetyltransferase
MQWPTIQSINEAFPLPHGYRFRYLLDSDIDALIQHLPDWHPNVRAGVASAFLDKSYYLNKVAINAEPEKDSVFLLIVDGKGSVIGFVQGERDQNNRSFYGGLGVIAPEHRGHGIHKVIPRLAEWMTRAMNFEFVYVMATLQHQIVQKMYESEGYTLIGFTPGYDREEVAPGVIKRVFEAVYAKVLISDDQLLWPSLDNLTPRARELFAAVFKS